MSANGNNAEQPKVKIICSRCNTHFSVPMPLGQITNTARFSSYIVTHEKMERCINCGQRFVLGLENVGLNFGFEAVPDDVANQLEESRIILPGPKRIDTH